MTPLFFFQRNHVTRATGTDEDTPQQAWYTYSETGERERVKVRLPSSLSLS
jgi:hypothetical protein